MSATNPIEFIGVQNRNVLNETTVAYKAAMKLAEDGYTVLEIAIGRGMPVITIVACDGCESLNGVETTESHISPESYMISYALYGCLVQWSRKGERP